MENYDDYDEESVDTQPGVMTAPPPAAAAPPAMFGGLPAAGPGQYRTPEGVLINGAPPPPPPDADHSAAMAELFRRVPIDQAAKAIEMANRLEGMLGFDADRKAGVPVMEALQKWSPKMYFNHPSAVASLQKAASVGTAVPFTPSVQKIGGRDVYRMGPNHWQFAPVEFKPGEVEVGGNKYMQASPNHLINVPRPPMDPIRKAELEDIKQDIAAIDKRIAGEESPKRIAALEAQKVTLRARKKAMITGGSAPVPAMPEAGTAPATSASVKRLVWKDGQLVPKE